MREKYVIILLHTYNSLFIPEGVAEASETFLRDAPTFKQNYLGMSNPPP
jgi:hypothetical protein